MGFTTRELIFIALMSALLFVLNFSLGAGVIAATGIPGSSALVDGITNLAIITFAALVIKKFGTMGLLYFIYGFIALPTHMGGGPPGFVWKIPLLAGSALIYDVVLYFTNFRKISFVIGLPIMTVFGFTIYLGTFHLMGLPEFDKFVKALPVLTAAFVSLGYVGMYIGFKLYDRMKDKRIIKQITS